MYYVSFLLLLKLLGLLFIYCITKKTPILSYHGLYLGYDTAHELLLEFLGHGNFFESPRVLKLFIHLRYHISWLYFRVLVHLLNVTWWLVFKYYLKRPIWRAKNEYTPEAHVYLQWFGMVVEGWKVKSILPPNQKQFRCTGCEQILPHNNLWATHFLRVIGFSAIFRQN